MKGNQLEDVDIKRTRIPDFDSFFSSASKPLDDLVSWNNQLDDMIFKFRKLGIDIRKLSTAEAPPAAGEVQLTVTAAGIEVSVVKDGAAVPDGKLDKVTKERLGLVKTKAKLLKDRLSALQKKEGLAEAKFVVDDKEPSQIKLVADKSVLSASKDEDVVIDMNRSMMKFNNRSALLVLQLQGNLTLAEIVSALLNSLKDELKKKSKEIKVSIENGMPKFDYPHDIEELLPELLARAWKLLQSLIDFLKQLVSDIPALEPQIQQILNEGKDLPSKAKSAAESAGLGAMEAIKAVKYSSSNLKELGRAPEISKVLLKTVQDTLLEIAGVIQKM